MLFSKRTQPRYPERPTLGNHSQTSVRLTQESLNVFSPKFFPNSPDRVPGIIRQASRVRRARILYGVHYIVQQRRLGKAKRSYRSSQLMLTKVISCPRRPNSRCRYSTANFLCLATRPTTTEKNMTQPMKECVRDHSRCVQYLYASDHKSAPIRFHVTNTKYPGHDQVSALPSRSCMIIHLSYISHTSLIHL